MTRLLILLMTVLLTFGTSLIVFSPPVRGAVDRTIEVLSPKTQKFTELYIEDHNSLPKKVFIGEDYTFKFSLHNLEQELYIYQYKVYFQHDPKLSNTNVPLSEGTVVLNHEEKETIPVTFNFEEPFTRGKVIIELIDKENSIHFWIDEISVVKES